MIQKIVILKEFKISNLCVNFLKLVEVVTIIGLNRFYLNKIDKEFNNIVKIIFVNDALLMAIKRRNPSKGLIYHTDRGSQYASYEHRDLLKQYGIIQSMSKKGDCWDNAVAESFFHSLKTELIHHEKFISRKQASEKIFEYIEIFYNRQRLHSSNGYMSPSEFEEKMLRLEMIS